MKASLKIAKDILNLNPLIRMTQLNLQALNLKPTPTLIYGLLKTILLSTSKNEFQNWTSSVVFGNLDDQVWYLENWCSGHMTGSKFMFSDFQPSVGPQATFGDNGTNNTEGYGALLHCLIKFSKLAYVNGLKHNLISINQLFDADYMVLFVKYQGTIFNINGEVVLIAPKRNKVHLVDFWSSLSWKETSFYSKANEEPNLLWHKRLSHIWVSSTSIN